MECLHQCEIAHNDIKTDNVLLVSKSPSMLSPVITDFGISRVLNTDQLLVGAFKTSRVNGFSLQFASPESIGRMRNGLMESDATVWKRGDVYSSGMLIKELVTRR